MLDVWGIEGDTGRLVFRVQWGQAPKLGDVVDCRCLSDRGDDQCMWRVKLVMWCWEGGAQQVRLGVVKLPLTWVPRDDMAALLGYLVDPVPGNSQQ